MAIHEEAVELLSKGYGLAADSVRKRHLVPKSIAVGVLAGLTGVALRYGSEALVEFREEYLHHFSGPKQWLIAAGTGGVFGAFAVWVVRRFCHEAGGGGTPHLQQTLAGTVRMRWLRLIPTKAVSLFSAAAAGMGGGAEAPSIQIGGAVGKGVAATMRGKCDTSEEKALITAGAAAGLSAAFNAPLTGLVFALEELQGNFNSKLLVSALLASVSADIVGRLAFGSYPIFERLHNIEPPELNTLPFAIFLGVCAGVIGVFFNRFLVRASRRGASVKSNKERVILGAVAGVISGVAMIWVPGVAGGGGMLISQSFSENLGLTMACGLFLARFASTLLFSATGAAGGFLIPLLAMGALAGHGLGELVRPYFPETVPTAGVLSVIGMGAFFSASIRAPLTGLVLMLELTGNYAFMLPTLVSCLVAFIVAEEFGDAPVYHALAGKDHKDHTTR